MGNRVGVLALQGAFERHIAACTEIGLEAIEVRSASDLDRIDRLIIPGGESTTMSMMLERNAMREPLAARLREGMPTFGTCAGMILLAADVSDGRADQHRFAAIDIGVRRNGYGRQNQSFSDELTIARLGEPASSFHAIFIRAPLVERVGDGVEVLATYDGHPVLCQSRTVLVSSFHPELATDRRLHRYFSGLS